MVNGQWSMDNLQPDMQTRQLTNLFFVCAAVIVSASTATAQCAMCKTNIAGADNAAEVSSAINSGVLVLLIPTLAIIGGVVRLIFKYRR
jgi:hypothetical protein